MNQPGLPRGPRTSAPSVRRGFTLIELVIVVAIAAVVAGIAVPRYTNSLDRYRLDAAAQHLIADLASARREAQLRSSSVKVLFNTTTNTCSLLGVQSFSQPGSAYVTNYGTSYGVSITSATFNDDTDLSDVPEDVDFDPYGVPDSGGTVVVAIGTASRTVTLDADSGEASLP